MPYADREKQQNYNKQYNKKRREVLKEQLAAQSKEYYEKNREAVIARQLASRKDPKVRQRINEWQAQYRLKNSARVKAYKRNHHLQSKYGISSKEFDERIAQQDGCCAMCRKPFDKTRARSPYVDHSHTTGKIRGIIHMNCNTTLGHAKDDIETLKAAIAYLEQHESYL